MQLRPYQSKSITEITTNRPLIYLATGSGKSVIFKSIAENATGKVCFVVYGKSIVDQAARKHFRGNVNIIMGAQKYKSGADIYCCSISTLTRNVKISTRLIEECNTFIIDEAHNATSDNYRNFLDAIPSHKKVIGLTATPFYVGNRGHSFWSQVIHPITTQGLIAQKYLVLPRVFGPPENMVTKVKTTAGEFNNKELFDANDSMNIYGNIIESWKKYALNKKTICFAINREHAKNLCTLFNDEGFKFVYADADTPQVERLEYINQLARGEINGIVNINIFSTGVDIPEIECGLMARPTKSLVLWIQQVGRALRPAPGKTEAIIIDNGGNCARLGHPLEDFDAQLLDKKPPREKTENELKTKTCPECFYVTLQSSDVCPSCQYAFKAAEQKKLETIQVDLVEYMLTFSNKHIKDDCPENILNELKSLSEMIAKKGWKKNSFFFKLTDEQKKYVRLPRWFQTIDTQDTKNWSSSLNTMSSERFQTGESSSVTSDYFLQRPDSQSK